MTLLIDTYNVLHTVGVLPPDLAGPDIQGLAWLISRSRYRRRKVRLVCDGVAVTRDDASLPKGAIVDFSGTKQQADDLIRSIIQHSSSPKRLLVVSTDREIRTSARKRRCAVLDSATFLSHLAEDAAAIRAMPEDERPDGPLPPEEVEQWLSQFQPSEREIAIRSATPATVQDNDPKPASDRTSNESDSSNAKACRRGETLPRRVIDEAERLLREQERDLEC